MWGFFISLSVPSFGPIYIFVKNKLEQIIIMMYHSSLVKAFFTGLIITVVSCFSLHGQTYYVSSSLGDDSNSGLSPDQPWRTTNRVNSASIGGGDSVLFKCGDLWNYEDGDYLRLRNGGVSNPLVYGSYGEGPQPVISRARPANNPDQWIDQGNNIWKFHDYVPGRDFNTAFISYNGAESIGAKKFSYDNMVQQGDFYTDEYLPNPSQAWNVHNYTYVCSSVNPALYYTDIQIVVGQSGIAADTEGTPISNVVIEKIDFINCGWNGIGFPRNSKNMLVDGCRISYCGGQRHVSNSKPDARRGQCINTQGDVENFEVRNCIVSEGWDGGIALQGWTSNLRIRNVRIHHNVIYKNEYGFEFWGVESNSDIQDVYFENNTCLYNGYGWAHAQRKNYKKRGASIFHWSFAGTAKNIIIRNNIFYKDRAPSFYIWDARNNKWKTAIHSDYNLLIDGYPEDATENEKALWFTDYKPTAEGNWSDPGENPSDLYTGAEWALWVHFNGFDANSIVMQEPLFINAYEATTNTTDYDLRLDDASPAIGTGEYIERYASHVDMWGYAAGCRHNIGAYNGGGHPDNAPPALLLQDAVVLLDADGIASIVQSDIIVEATDDCRIADISVSRNTFSCEDAGQEVPVVVSVSDEAGNVTTDTCYVLVTDDMPPSVELPADASVYANSPDDTYTVFNNEFDPVLVTDNCGYVVENSFNSGSTVGSEILMEGMNMIIWTVADHSGNQSVDTMYVEVLPFDDEPPVLEVVNDTLYLDFNGEARVDLERIIAHASDNAGVADTIISRELFTCDDLNASLSTVVTLRDINGNEVSDTSEIVLLDTIAPVFDLISDTMIMAGSDGSFRITDTGFDPFGLEENCSFTLVNSWNESSTLSGAEFPVGSHEITWRMSDHSGNTTERSISIQVEPYVGMEQPFSEIRYSLYPNPAFDYFYLDFSEDILYDFTVTDQTGRRIMSENHLTGCTTINTSQLSRGLYLVKIVSGEWMITEKLIIASQ
jgi:hypothetical protein